MVFIEDYDMNVARYLVQGVDVWMNTPRRPYEASGTSGMKAALNGGINFSILDGWWRESYNGKNGWAIGEEREYDSTDAQDQADSESLFDILENQIVPLYYDRDDDGTPACVVGMGKRIHDYGCPAVQHAPHGEAVCQRDVRAVDGGVAIATIEVFATVDNYTKLG